MPAHDIQRDFDVTSKSYNSGVCSTLRYVILQFLHQNLVILLNKTP